MEAPNQNPISETPSTEATKEEGQKASTPTISSSEVKIEEIDKSKEEKDSSDCSESSVNSTESSEGVEDVESLRTLLHTVSDFIGRFEKMAGSSNEPRPFIRTSDSCVDSREEEKQTHLSTDSSLQSEITADVIGKFEKMAGSSNESRPCIKVRDAREDSREEGNRTLLSDDSSLQSETAAEAKESEITEEKQIDMPAESTMTSLSAAESTKFDTKMKEQNSDTTGSICKTDSAPDSICSSVSEDGQGNSSIFKSIAAAVSGALRKVEATISSSEVLLPYVAEDNEEGKQTDVRVDNSLQFISTAEAKETSSKKEKQMLVSADSSLSSISTTESTEYGTDRGELTPDSLYKICRTVLDSFAEPKCKISLASTRKEFADAEGKENPRPCSVTAETVNNADNNEMLTEVENALSTDKNEGQETDEDAERKATFYISSSCSIPGIGEGPEWQSFSGECEDTARPRPPLPRQDSDEPIKCLGTENCHWFVLFISICSAVGGIFLIHYGKTGVIPKVYERVGTSTIFLSVVVAVVSSIYISYLRKYPVMPMFPSYEYLGDVDTVQAMNKVASPELYYGEDDVILRNYIEFRENRNLSVSGRRSGDSQTEVKRRFWEEPKTSEEQTSERFKTELAEAVETLLSFEKELSTAKSMEFPGEPFVADTSIEASNDSTKSSLYVSADLPADSYDSEEYHDSDTQRLLSKKES